MTSPAPQYTSVDELLTALYHDSAVVAVGRPDLKKVLDDADAYCIAYPSVFASSRRKLLHARLRVVDERLTVSVGNAIQAALLDEPRYLVVAINERRNVEVAEPTDWDAAYGIELDEYLKRVTAHAETTRRYRVIRSAWLPGERLPDVVGRLRAAGQI